MLAFVKKQVFSRMPVVFDCKPRVSTFEIVLYCKDHIDMYSFAANTRPRKKVS